MFKLGFWAAAEKKLKGVNNMPTEKETLMIQKATVYDLQRILDKGESGKTYTAEEIKELMDAYIKGAEQ